MYFRGVSLSDSYGSFLRPWRARGGGGGGKHTKGGSEGEDGADEARLPSITRETKDARGIERGGATGRADRENRKCRN